ncbi:MAG TPA: MBL fold metallo-hydrolase [Patescibacteria group bacterium]|nr:MBL fold metallo-hydrolase [Patescibacteria group bacterium]
MKNIKITCISENTSSFLKSRFLASHGQSLLLEIDDKKYLFDTSAIYEGFTYNLDSLGIKLADIPTVILSHNHLDHSGALFKLVDELSNQQLLLPPDMQQIHDIEGYKLTFKIENKEAAIQKLLDYKHTVIVTDGKQLDENLYTTGSLESADKEWPDKEQSLSISVAGKGLVILVGCSHPTISVIVEHARKVTGIEKVYGIIGGLHYARLNKEELLKNVEYLESLQLDFIVPSHCTGHKATALMEEVLGEKVRYSLIGGQFGSGNSVTILPELSFNLS